MATISNLDKYLYNVRRIEEHREEAAVKELQKLYKKMIQDLRAKLGNVYADYADPDTGELTYTQLHKSGTDARLLEEIAAHVSSVTEQEAKLIKETVEQTYTNCYSGMIQAVESAVDDDSLAAAFASVSAAKPQALKAAVDNPVHGLTLSSQLEKNRADIVYTIKQTVGVGLSMGDRYDTMARRIQQSLIGDKKKAGGSYAKAIRIARTEAHRCREQGNFDAAVSLNEKLEPAGVTMMKTWHTMKDNRVRPQHRYKTKSGWKYSKKGKYNHEKMEGVSVPINEKFKLPSGAEADAPGKSGVAGEDINCRCFLSYTVERVEGYAADKKSVESLNGSDIMVSGARITDPESEKGKAFAESYYPEIRKRTTDAAKIAANIGKEESEIQKIKNYLFIDDSLYDDDLQVWRRFDADCAIAQSWQRLTDGKNIQKHDLTLIEHELYEMKIKISNPGISHDEAHALAQAKYNYKKEAEEFYGNLG